MMYIRCDTYLTEKSTNILTITTNLMNVDISRLFDDAIWTITAKTPQSFEIVPVKECSEAERKMKETYLYP